MAIGAVEAVNPAGISGSSLVFTDYPAWHSLMLFITVIATLILFVIGIRRLWRDRRNLHQSGYPPHGFTLLALVVLSVGLLDFLLSLATLCDHYTLASGNEARIALFMTSLSGRLRTLAVSLGTATLIYLIPGVLFWSSKRRTSTVGKT